MSSLAARLVRGQAGAPLAGRRVSDAFAALHDGATGRHTAPTRRQPTSFDVIEAAVALRFSDFDQGLSLVDCTLLVCAGGARAPIAMFGRHFQGLVVVVDA